jgi:hypothetical protein
LFAFGLSLTAVANFNDVAALFPALPTDLLRSSALGGGLIELFLGKSALVSNSATAIASGYSVVPLHPIAIAGFVGLLSNALALLPIGSKYSCRRS